MYCNAQKDMCGALAAKDIENNIKTKLQLFLLLLNHHFSQPLNKTECCLRNAAHIGITQPQLGNLTAPCAFNH